MALVITDEELKRTGLTEEQLKLELAIHLFELDVFTLGQAASFAGLYQMQMMEELAKRKISLHYSLEDLEYDYKNIVNEGDADNK